MKRNIMNNLLISGNSETTKTWDVENILQDDRPTKSLKRMVEDMEFEMRAYSQSRREMYENFYLNERLKNY